MKVEVYLAFTLACGLQFSDFVEQISMLNIQFFATLWTVACQAALSMEFSRQEYWSGLSFPTPGDFPDSGIEPAFPALAGGFFTTKPPGKPLSYPY